MSVETKTFRIMVHAERWTLCKILNASWSEASWWARRVCWTLTLPVRSRTMARSITTTASRCKLKSKTKYFSWNCGTPIAQIITRLSGKFITKTAASFSSASPLWTMNRLGMLGKRWALEIAQRRQIYCESFQWIPEARKCCPSAPCIIVGTKGDLRQDKVSLLRLDRIQNQKPITGDEGRKLAKRMSAVKYLECSAVSGVRIASAISFLEFEL